MPAAWAERDGIFVHSGLLAAGLPHGVSTRSRGNMKDAAALGRLAAAAGIPAGALRMVRQVHGTRVVDWEEGRDPLGPDWDQAPQADALFLDRPGRAIGVFAADCAPVFVWDKSGSAIGLAHMGWRGAAAGMARSLVEAMSRGLGLDPKDLLAAVGPHIGACCYAVGPEVAGRFPPAALSKKGPDGKLHLSLGAAARLQLEEGGLDPGRIGTDAPCTSCMSGSFFSYRREKADLRMLAFAAKA